MKLMDTYYTVNCIRRLFPEMNNNNRSRSIQSNLWEVSTQNIVYNNSVLVTGISKVPDLCRKYVFFGDSVETISIAEYKHTNV